MRMFHGDTKTRRIGAAMAGLAVALVLNGCAPSGESQQAGSGDAPRETPSALDHTYHGEAVKARARAIRTLQGVDAERKEQQQEERSFDRPAAPTPRENP
jgi:hypothetical protein